MLAGVLPLLFLALWVFALVHCLTSSPEDVRYLPKFAWLAIVFFLPVIGSVAWFALGRPKGTGPAPRLGRTATGKARSLRPRRVEEYDDPRYSPTAGITDRRSAELDLEIERWERAQREAKDREAAGDE
jgi:hypothetical protein